MCNQRIMSVLTVFYIILFLWQTVEANNFFMFRSDPVFDGYRCSPNKTIYQTLERNILECAETCYVNSFCYSFSYQKESGICVGCAGYYHNSEILIGSSYFGRYSTRCPPGWIKRMKHCYHISSKQTRVNMTSAMIECARMGGRLVEIHSVQQYEHVATLTTESQAIFWIGLKFKEGEFLWLSNGELSWNLGEYIGHGKSHSGANQHCAVYGWEKERDYWGPEFCQNEHGFICERSTIGQ